MRLTLQHAWTSELVEKRVEKVMRLRQLWGLVSYFRLGYSGLG